MLVVGLIVSHLQTRTISPESFSIFSDLHYLSFHSFSYFVTQI
jgi:hypothetical protein